MSLLTFDLLDSLSPVTACVLLFHCLHGSPQLLITAFLTWGGWSVEVLLTYERLGPCR